MKAKLHYVLSMTMFLFVFSVTAQKNYFKKANETNTARNNAKTASSKINNQHIYQFSYAELSKTLSNTHNKKSFSKDDNLIISLPNVEGEFENYSIEEASIMHPDLQAKYPEIRSYIGYNINNPSSHVRFSLSPYKGLTAVVLGGNETLVFEPVTNSPNKIKVSNKSDNFKDDSFECEVVNSISIKTLKSSSFKDADDSQKRTYRLAMSVTGEYSQLNGGTLASVNAAIVATLNNVNAVFENDFNVSMQLIATNDDVVYLDPNTDPYSGVSDNNYNNDLATTLDTEVMEANYDIGHLLAGIGNNGNAGCIGCVCNNGGSVAMENHKGSGFTTSSNPSGINFDIDLVAHEIGHQFGANHTWTHDGNEGENVQMEPGSGSTIMGYAGITGSTNVQLHSDTYFHAISIEQVTNFVKSTSCATITNTGNTTPTVNAGSDLILPVGTPFKLVGTGNDVDGDAITYCWEQVNEDNAVTIYPNPNSANSNSVLFRSFSPTTNTTRSFPNLSDLKFGVDANQWERIPNVTRTADFRLTVRDNKPGGANNAHDDMQIQFDATYGPFEITSQNTSGSLWVSGTNETINWEVNNTNALTGASNVNILLSTDGGLNYNTILASNVPNNGSFSVVVPNIPAPYCRIMIEPTNNSFFAINSEDFAIDYTVNTTCTQYSSALGLGISIDDNGDDFTQTNSINIGPSSTITIIRIGVDITHSYIGDLLLAVLSPNNTQAILKTPSDCSSEEDLITIYNDNANTFNCFNASSNQNFKSINDPLSLFNGEDTSGNWTIGLGDFEPGDIGTLNSWYVEVCETTETPLDVDSYDKLSGLLVFPNPNKGEFTIKLNNALSSDVNVEVYDLRGRNIYKNMYKNTGDFNEKIRLNNIQSGMYILNVSDGNRKSTRKIIVE